MSEIDRAQTVAKLQADQSWRITVLGKKWLCPYCGALGASWSDNPEEMVNEVHDHLSTECAEYASGGGAPIPFDKLKMLQFTHEVKHRLRHDETWRIKDRNNRWIDPYSGRVTEIVIKDDEPLTRQKFQEIVDYLTSLPEFADGAGEPKPMPYLRARRDFLDNPAWKVISPEGKWISPFTAKETPIAYHDQRDPEEIWGEIWKHLLYCRVFNNGQGQARPLHELTRNVERGERLNALSKAVADKFQSDGAWQYFNVQGLWQCPFCSVGVGNIKPQVDNPINVRMASVNIAKHLMYACHPFQESTKNVEIEQLPAYLDHVAPVPMAEAQPVAIEDDPFAQPYAISPSIQVVHPSPPPPVAASPVATPVPAAYNAVPAAPMNLDSITLSTEGAIPRPNLTTAVHTNITRAIQHKEEVQSDEKRDQAFEEARKKQLKMLPEPPEIEGLECAVVYQPCDMVGGDFYDFIQLRDNKLGIVQGDVSGHGLEVWGDMTMAMKTLRIYAKQCTSAAEMLRLANEDLVPDLMAKTFVSAFYNILDLDNFKMKMARAGHNPLILFNPDRKPQSLIQYEPKGMVLGMAAGRMFDNTLEEIEIQLYSGDMLLWYTDGLTETMNPAGDEFGVERLCEVIEAHGRREAEYLLQKILEGMQDFREGLQPDDDITMITVRII